MSNIERVDFYGDKLEVVLDGDRPLVVVRSVCDALGVSAQPQMAKLKTKPWATITMIVTVGADGKNRQMAAISLHSLPMWLATIEPSKVAKQVRSKLEKYQLEAHDVLAAHFTPEEPPAPPPSPFGSGPVQARIDDDVRARDAVRRLCRVAARVSGIPVQRIQGMIRKPWGVMSIYRIALAAYDHTVSQLNAIIDSPPPKRLPRDRRQTDLFGEN